MFDDPIVLETRKRREEYAASFGFDLGRIVADLQSRQGRDGRMVIDRSCVRESEQADADEPPVGSRAMAAPDAAAI
jgi:uncharacterized protein YggE